MTTEIENLAERVLRLTPPTRAYLAQVLLESLDFEEDFALSAEWQREIAQRCQQIDHGEVELLAGEEALARLKETYL